MLKLPTREWLCTLQYAALGKKISDHLIEEDPQLPVGDFQLNEQIKTTDFEA
jgi:hypothetical protein